MHTFSLADVADWLSLPVHLSRSPVQRVVTDSGLVQQGDLFVALKGARVDGHAFLKDVASKGAIAALVSGEYQGEDYGLTLIRVPKVIPALQEMAKKRLKSLPIRIVGVTGSVGKTTTKDFLATLLSARFRVGKSPGNANSQVGVPITILNLRDEIDILVLEMGMSGPGHISKLIDIAPPEASLITKIGHSHAEFFTDGIEGIAAAKAEIFSHPATKLAIANFTAKKFSSLAAAGTGQKIYVGESPEADVRILIEKDGVRFEEKNNKSCLISLPFHASHLIENFSLAATMAHLLGVSYEEIAKKAKELSTYKNRFEIVERDEVIFLNDSYNASPESMKAALDNLPSKKGKAIAVFGEMKELGKFTQAAHHDIAKYSLDKIDHMLCYGVGCAPMLEVFSSAGKPAEFFSEFSALKKRVFELAEKGDLVLLKGSNSNQLWRILENEGAGL